jgi:hypothetical protein
MHSHEAEPMLGGARLKGRPSHSSLGEGVLTTDNEENNYAPG